MDLFPDCGEDSIGPPVSGSALLLVGGRLVNEREGLDYLPVEHSELGYLLTHCYLY